MFLLSNINSIDSIMSFMVICRCVSRVHDEWFADEEKVRDAVGLLEKPLVDFPTDAEVCLPFFVSNIVNFFLLFILFFLSFSFWQLTCGICFETFLSDKLHAAACGHPFCESCWEGIDTHFQTLSWLLFAMFCFSFPVDVGNSFFIFHYNLHF